MRWLKERFMGFISNMITIAGKVGVRLHLLKEMVIVRVDGGICSQMNFVVFGECLRKKGYSVKYDLSWFGKDGRDLDGVDVRNWDFPKIFPDIKIPVSSGIETFLYRKVFYYQGDSDGLHFYDWEDKLKPPCYAYGYYKWSNTKAWLDIFDELFRVDYTILDENSMEIYRDIISKNNAVGVHVRRGDLAKYNAAYGEPLKEQYFIDAVTYLIKEHGCSDFYYFSDDKIWCAGLIDKIRNRCDTNHNLVNLNGSDKGYQDLMLLSACPIKVCSKGSLGQTAVHLSGTTTKCVILPKAEQSFFSERQMIKVVYV